ncbi:hypothetical protein BBJ29_002289 [Phytophthora kernoviae]|uniref:Presenilin n=1 Tax=Phytophthora kernoviae TaxID=325452 RepID=A0A3F2RY06_9STRA|nr:hypothetical protein BBP00_00002210 [Phytophthora kernoviae]RLN70326.1 hypothetical protein BBJ29_002289 [Phytophthora kernoviae]
MQGAGKIHQVCCMWDTYVLMGATNRNETKKLTIPVVYMTIAEGKKLQRALEKYPTTLVARTYRRELPLVDLSSILLWCIGVTTALGAAYYSASSIRRYSENASAREQRKLQQQQQTGGREEEVRDQHEEIWELDTKHAVGFIALAGVFLTVFYYVKIGGVIPVLFALSSAATLTQVLPNLKVATILLSLAFCYDVFFVFLSPTFFGSSVMEDVATGGPAAYTKSDYPGVDYCERSNVATVLGSVGNYDCMNALHTPDGRTLGKQVDNEREQSKLNTRPDTHRLIQMISVITEKLMAIM